VQCIDEPHHSRGYRELLSNAEMRKLPNRKIVERNRKCGMFGLETIFRSGLGELLRFLCGELLLHLISPIARIWDTNVYEPVGFISDTT
jgi:hypothetical protein